MTIFPLQTTQTYLSAMFKYLSLISALLFSKVSDAFNKIGVFNNVADANRFLGGGQPQQAPAMSFNPVMSAPQALPPQAAPIPAQMNVFGNQPNAVIAPQGDSTASQKNWIDGKYVNPRDYLNGSGRPMPPGL
jgi:hypothetical protein